MVPGTYEMGTPFHLTWVRSTISILFPCELPWSHRKTHMATLGSSGCFHFPTLGTKLEPRIWGKKEFGTTSHIPQESSSWTKAQHLGLKTSRWSPNAVWISRTRHQISHFLLRAYHCRWTIHSMTCVVVLCSADLPLGCHATLWSHQNGGFSHCK